MSELLKLQQCFSAAMTSGDTKLLETLADTNPKFPPSKRIESYRYGIFVRFEDSLLEDFPLLKEALGAEEFKKILSDYVRKYPSQNYNLSELGLSLPDYFQNFPMDDHPYAKDLAQFEVEKLFADNCDKNEDALPIEGIETEDLSSVKLVFDRSVRLFSSDWSVLESPVIKKRSFILIHETSNLELHCMELSEEMFVVTKNLLQGQSLPQATAQLNEQLAPVVSAFFADLIKLRIAIGYQKIH